MSSAAQPLVSVVIPVFNGEKYLAECLDSVLAQTYTCWDCVIVNNCSTDGTLALARRYEQNDGRIRVNDNREKLPIMPNWNHALRQISPRSKYCKVVHADDWLFPECLEQMVRVAEESASIAIVGSYRLEENRVTLDGLPFPSRHVPGATVCRATLLGKLYVFGAPSNLLLRSDVIRCRPDFYNPENLHADAEACYDVLRDADFGFVHQVLTFTRRHNESETTFARRVNSYLPGDLTALVKYGRFYLTESEYEQRFKHLMRHYYKFLARGVFGGRNQEFWNYHRSELQKLGCPINRGQLAKTCVQLAVGYLLHPVWTVRGLMSRMRHHSGGSRPGLGVWLTAFLR